MIDCLFFMKEVGAFGLSTPETFVHSLFQLTEDLGSNCYNSFDSDQFRQMFNSQLRNFINDRQLIYFDIGFLDDIFELW